MSVNFFERELAPYVKQDGTTLQQSRVLLCGKIESIKTENGATTLDEIVDEKYPGWMDIEINTSEFKDPNKTVTDEVLGVQIPAPAAEEKIKVRFWDRDGLMKKLLRMKLKENYVVAISANRSQGEYVNYTGNKVYYPGSEISFNKTTIDNGDGTGKILPAKHFFFGYVVPSEGNGKTHLSMHISKWFKSGNAYDLAEIWVGIADGDKGAVSNDLDITFMKNEKGKCRLGLIEADSNGLSANTVEKDGEKKTYYSVKVEGTHYASI